MVVSNSEGDHQVEITIGIAVSYYPMESNDGW